MAPSVHTRFPASGARPPSPRTSVLPQPNSLLTRSGAAPSVPSPRPSPTAATRHLKRVVPQIPNQKAPHHFVHRAADLRDHLDACRTQGQFQRPRDRTADQHVRRKPGNLECSPSRIHGGQRDLSPADFTGVCDLDKQESFRHVEDG